MHKYFEWVSGADSEISSCESKACLTKKLLIL